MAEGTDSSFIPKNANRVKKPRAGKRIYVFSYISYIFFFGTLLAVFGTYFYASQVERALESYRAELAAESTRFSEGDIDEVRNLEKRLIIANELLAESNAPSRIFESLEAVVADTFRIMTFTYERLVDNTIVLSFGGGTDTFDAALFQRELVASMPGLDAATVVDFAYSELADSEDGILEDRLIVTFEGTTDATAFPYEAPVADTPDIEQPSTEEVAATSTPPAEEPNEL